MQAVDLVFHGAVILFFGLIAGAPYGRAILMKKPEKVATAWRVAHTGLILGAVLLFAIAGILPLLGDEGSLRSVIGSGFLVSGYAFAVAAFGGAWAGQRGLRFRGTLTNSVFFVLNIIGVLASVLATLVLMYVSWPFSI